MDPVIKSSLLFVFGCLPVRLLFVYLAKYHKKYLPYMSIIAAVIGSGFLYIYVNDLRKTGMETFGKEIWWNNLRPFHSLMYFTFAYLGINNKDIAWIPLAVDVAVGASAFTIKRTLL